MEKKMFSYYSVHLSMCSWPQNSRSYKTHLLSQDNEWTQNSRSHHKILTHRRTLIKVWCWSDLIGFEWFSPWDLTVQELAINYYGNYWSTQSPPQNETSEAFVLYWSSVVFSCKCASNAAIDENRSSSQPSRCPPTHCLLYARHTHSHTRTHTHTIVQCCIIAY